MRLKTGVLFALMLWTACVMALEGAEELYRQAELEYRERNYDEAVTLLQQAITEAPAVARYHHLLGKCFGRMAQTAGPFRALSLATSTRREFEKAVELDGENIEALQDLMEYYREAPGFLGGSREKADEIAKKLARLQAGAQQDSAGGGRQKDLDSSVM